MLRDLGELQNPPMERSASPAVQMEPFENSSSWIAECSKSNSRRVELPPDSSARSALASERVRRGS